MRFFTDDPVADFARHDAEQERWLSKRPVCTHCGDHIQEDRFYLLDGTPICIPCMESDYLCYTEDYMDLEG